jgi:hypothetical protein
MRPSLMVPLWELGFGYGIGDRCSAENAAMTSGTGRPRSAPVAALRCRPRARGSRPALPHPSRARVSLIRASRRGQASQASPSRLALVTHPRQGEGSTVRLPVAGSTRPRRRGSSMARLPGSSSSTVRPLVVSSSMARLPGSSSMARPLARSRPTVPRPGDRSSSTVRPLVVSSSMARLPGSSSTVPRRAGSPVRRKQDGAAPRRLLARPSRRGQRRRARPARGSPSTSSGGRLATSPSAWRP